MAFEAEPEDKLTPGDLLKQRRLLLGVTFVLAAIYFLNVEVGSSATIQGLVVTFDHPVAIIIALWIAWAWACWRYWQYEREYSSDSLRAHRTRIWRRRAEGRLTAEIQLRVDRGDYSPQGLNPGDRILASPRNWAEVDLRIINTEWEFANIDIWTVGGGKGGTNLILDSSEVTEIKRATERELRIRHRHFADWQAPYYLLWLAPIALVFHVVQWLLHRSTGQSWYTPWGG